MSETATDPTTYLIPGATPPDANGDTVVDFNLRGVLYRFVFDWPDKEQRGSYRRTKISKTGWMKDGHPFYRHAKVDWLLKSGRIDHD